MISLSCEDCDTSTHLTIKPNISIEILEVGETLTYDERYSK